jgi:hypothetical protein
VLEEVVVRLVRLFSAWLEPPEKTPPLSEAKGLQIIKVLLPVPWLVDVVCASRTRSVPNSP